jgi:basic amino acid/polyamine antiporter, APA family
VLLTLTGTYEKLNDYVVFGDWIFFGLVVSTLFVYRRREARGRAAGAPPAAGPVFRAWGYPWTPALFVAAAVYVVIGSIVSNPGNAAMGAGLLALGVPVFLFWRARRAPIE